MALLGDVLIYDVGTQKVITRIHILDPKDGFCVIATAFSPDSGAIAVANSANTWMPLPLPKELPTKTPVEVFRVADGARIAAYPPIVEPAQGLGWSPDGRFVAFITRKGLHLWDPAHPGVLRSMDLPGTEGLAFSPNGWWIAVCSDYSVDVFEIKNYARDP